MAQSIDDDLTSHGEMVFDDEFLDDSAPTRVSIDPRSELRQMMARELRHEQIRVGDLLVGKYRVERIHRRGALGLTFEALHTQLGQRVSVRLLSADPKAYPEAAARFLRGARAAVQFQNEHTARIVDVGCLESSAPYIVAEWLTGSDLQRVLRVRESLPVSEAVDFVLQACAGLADAHAHNIVHRNLKPTNLFLTRDEGVRRVAVLDFGVSEDPLSDTAINLGGTHGAAKALSYLAPEQIRDPSSVDARADIWALGAILHEMLTGSRLHEANATAALLAMIAADAPVPLSHLRPDVPMELEAVVLRAVAKEREARYANLAEFGEALRPFASEAGYESIARIAKALGRCVARPSPPPLPSSQRSKAIVHVARPPAAHTPAAEAPVNTRRWAELALTAAGLAAAGALGVFFAVHTMEGALAAAIAPRTVVAGVSPAVPASATAGPVTPVSLPAAVAPQALPTSPATPVAPLPAVAQAPQPVVPAAASAASALPIALSVAVAPVGPLPVAPRPTSRPLVAPASPRRAVASAAMAERAVVADAKPVAANPPAQTTGLFDDAN